MPAWWLGYHDVKSISRRTRRKRLTMLARWPGYRESVDLLQSQQHNVTMLARKPDYRDEYAVHERSEGRKVGLLTKPARWPGYRDYGGPSQIRRGRAYAAAWLP